LTIFKPRVVGVVLQNADVAHGSFNAYAEVVRRNDAAIGELITAIKGDDELRDSTAVFVLPEFGRDRDLNSRRGLDHGDGSDDLNYVQGVAWGPDFKRGREVTEDLRTIDVTPTICGLFGAEAKLAKGQALRGLFG
jgi:arylsulfatase A-like enzyme